MPPSYTLKPGPCTIGIRRREDALVNPGHYANPAYSWIDKLYRRAEPGFRASNDWHHSHWGMGAKGICSQEQGCERCHRRGAMESGPTRLRPQSRCAESGISRFSKALTRQGYGVGGLATNKGRKREG